MVTKVLGQKAGSWRTATTWFSQGGASRVFLTQARVLSLLHEQGGEEQPVGRRRAGRVSLCPLLAKNLLQNLLFFYFQKVRTKL